MQGASAPAPAGPVPPPNAAALYRSALDAYAARDYATAAARSQAAVETASNYESATRLWRAAQALLSSRWSREALDVAAMRVQSPAIPPGNLDDAIRSLQGTLSTQHPGRPLEIRNLAGPGVAARAPLPAGNHSLDQLASALAERHRVDVLTARGLLEFVPKTDHGWSERERALREALPPPPPPPDFGEHPDIALRRMVCAPEPVRLFEIEGSPSADLLRQGPELARVRAGFLASVWRRQGSLLVLQLDLPLGGHRVVCAESAAFVPVIGTAGLPVPPFPFPPPPDPLLAHRAAGLRVEELPPKPATLLRHARTTELLFTNGRGSIRRCWRVAPTEEDSPFGVTETLAGRFFGRLETEGAESAAMTWDQLLRERDRPYRFTDATRTPVTKGGIVLEIADFSDRKRPLLVSANPQAYRFRASHYPLALEGGSVALRACIDADIHPGVEYTTSVTGADPSIAGDLPALQPGAMLRSIRVRFEGRTEPLAWFTVEFEVLDPVSGRPARLQKTIEMENDPDGSIRFTDGTRIHEIAQAGSLIERRTYGLEENPFAGRP